MKNVILKIIWFFFQNYPQVTLIDVVLIIHLVPNIVKSININGTSKKVREALGVYLIQFSNSLRNSKLLTRFLFHIRIQYLKIIYTEYQGSFDDDSLIDRANGRGKGKESCSKVHIAHCETQRFIHRYFEERKNGKRTLELSS